MDRITTGIDTLDELLQGGIPEGATVLLSGRPGSGKTIMAHQMMFANASPDFKVIHLSTLSEPQVKILRFQQQFEYFDMSKFQRHVVYHDLGYIIRGQGPAQALAAISELLKEHQPRLLVVDTVKVMADIIPSFIELREFLLDLSVRVATWGCTILLVGEYCEEEIDLRPESAIADGIIYLSGTQEKKQQKRFLRVLKMRGTCHVGGENLFQIGSKGVQMFPRLNPVVGEQSYQTQFSQRVSTGIAALDDMMSGGLPSGTTTLLSGSSGTGKTVLAVHYTRAALEAGGAVVYVSYEENPPQLLQTGESLGMPLADYQQDGRLKLLHTSPMELDVDEHIFRVQRLVTDLDASALVIDSISSFEVGMENKEKYTDYIWALTDYFKVQGVNVLLTHEIHDRATPAHLTKHGISYVADNLLLLRFLQEGWDMKRYVRVVKMRGSYHDTQLRELVFSPGGISLGGLPGVDAQD